VGAASEIPNIREEKPNAQDTLKIGVVNREATHALGY
jgi:hypothetical protein